MNIAALRQMQADLQAVTAVNTVKIGLEAAMTSDDYPIIRIVVASLAALDDYYDTEAEVDILFGEDIHQFDGNLELIYESQLAMNAEIVEILESSTDYSARWIDTEMDRDQFSEYKTSLARFSVKTTCV